MSSTTTQEGTAARTQARVRAAARYVGPAIAPAVTATRRVVHPRTFAGLLRAWFRGIGKFFVWLRHWLRADDKLYLIEKGASAGNRQAHHLWCYWRKKTSQILTVMMLTSVLASYLLWGWAGVLPYWLGFSTMFIAMGRDRPVVVPKDAVPAKRVINNELVRQVVASAVQGIKPDNWEDVRILGPGVVRDGQWWTVRLELPGTVPGVAAKKALPALMSGFGVGPMQLFVDIDQANSGIVTITGTNENPWKRPPTNSPLETAETWSIWDAVPLAVDGRGRRIFASVMFTGWLIGAVPRKGKTALARLLAMAAALDPWCDLIVFDLKGSADWRMFRPLCRAFGLGHTDKTIADLVRVLTAVQKEIDRRSDIIGELDLERCPDGHLTRELALDPELGMQPLIIFIDEIQWAFQHRIYKKQMIELCEGIVKGGQYVGITLVIATQKPDAKSVPSEVRDVIASRAALYCKTRQASETILGTSAYSEGWNAADLPDIEGLAILYGEEEDAGFAETVIARTDYADLVVATAVAARAGAARDKIGRLPKQRQVDPLVRMCRDYQGDRTYVPASELLGVLNMQPEYADTPWTADTLGKALREKGCESFAMNKQNTRDKELPVELKNRKGYNFLTTREEDATL